MFFDDFYCGVEVLCFCEVWEDGFDFFGGGIEGDVCCFGLSGWNFC